jgi:hypothetical protein
MALATNLLVGLGRPLPSGGELATSRSECSRDEHMDVAVNWQSPLRALYRCVRDEEGNPACQRWPAQGGGLRVSAVAPNLSRMNVRGTYPTCSACVESCIDPN